MWLLSGSLGFIGARSLYSKTKSISHSCMLPCHELLLGRPFSQISEMCLASGILSLQEWDKPLDLQCKAETQRHSYNEYRLISHRLRERYTFLHITDMIRVSSTRQTNTSEPEGWAMDREQWYNEWCVWQEHMNDGWCHMTLKSRMK